MKKLVVFDLDGTLTYTLKDIQTSLNLTLRRYGYREVTIGETRKFVGDGARKLVERALKSQLPDNFEEILKFYNDTYNFCGSPETYLYYGIKETVEKLKKDGYMLAVLSNKPQQGATEVINKFFEKGTFDCVFGQREGVKVKPHPDCVNALLKELSAKPEETIMVGDGETDYLTAKNAETDGISVLWGYRTKEELIKAGAKVFASTPEELYTLVAKYK